MVRRCFYSFHYAEDSWRVSTVKQIGAIEGQPLVRGNQWEEIERRGEAAIRNWIDENLKGRSCLIVLVGRVTAGRKWVKYEIEKAWNEGKGVLGVRIHNLKNQNGATSAAGANPFASYNVNGAPLTNWAKVYDPAGATSQEVYNTIANNIEKWVEEAIRLRGTV
ncbi:TIR domain-containing protein [Novosphingobium clariflavum]|uniref:TIR domain-containing protein n=1 Tax=Novosphingobium clariflavum TaxID=2029884 RepID=A0ABV6S454_9SPHN|nr:TIR domain-containing protein [Novosphingobium clariflavum]